MLRMAKLRRLAQPTQRVASPVRPPEGVLTLSRKDAIATLAQPVEQPILIGRSQVRSLRVAP